MTIEELLNMQAERRNPGTSEIPAGLLQFISQGQQGAPQLPQMGGGAVQAPDLPALPQYQGSGSGIGRSLINSFLGDYFDTKKEERISKKYKEDQKEMDDYLGKANKDLTPEQKVEYLARSPDPEARKLAMKSYTTMQTQAQKAGVTPPSLVELGVDPNNPNLVAKGYIDPKTGLQIAGENYNRFADKSADIASKNRATDVREQFGFEDIATRRERIAADIRRTAETNATRMKVAELKKNPEGVNSKDYAKLADTHSNDLQTVDASGLQVKNAISKIDEILSPENKYGFQMNFGGRNALVSREVSGQPLDTKAKIESLKSDMMSAGLSLMRQGGGVGSITQQEWPIFEKMVSNISPLLSEDAAKLEFGKVKKYLQDKHDMVKKGYDQTWSKTDFYKGENKPFVPTVFGTSKTGKKIFRNKNNEWEYVK